jgi:hypothetical protein
MLIEAEVNKVKGTSRVSSDSQRLLRQFREAVWVCATEIFLLMIVEKIIYNYVLLSILDAFARCSSYCRKRRKQDINFHNS